MEEEATRGVVKESAQQKTATNVGRTYELERRLDEMERRLDAHYRAMEDLAKVVCSMLPDRTKEQGHG